MKKIKYLLIVLITFLTLNMDCYASTNTYTRTMDNLLLPSDVKDINNEMYQDILNTPAVAANEKIYDFANLIPDNKELDLTNEIADFKKNSNMDIVIVTTSDLKGFQLPEYTYNFYDYNDFAKNGVTLVIYTGGKSPEIFMGNSGDEGSFIFTTYTEARTHQTLSYIYNGYIKSGDYYGACEQYIKIIAGFYATDVGGVGKDVGNGGGIRWVEITILSIALAVIFNLSFMLFLSKYKITSRKVEVMDKKINRESLSIEQVQDSPALGNNN